MGLWSRYIAWIDRDLDRALPSLKAWSALVPFVPPVPAGLWLAFRAPPESTRLMVVGVAGVVSAVLFGIWMWRVIAALIWQPPK